jgi:hypothetical protein
VDYLSDMCLAPVGQRAYPFPYATEIKDDTPEDTEKVSGYGDIVVSQEGKYTFTIKMKEEVGILLWKKIMKFRNSNSYGFLMEDSDGNLFGRVGPAAGDIMVVPAAMFYPKKVKLADGTDEAQYHIKVVFDDPKDLNENSAFVIPEKSIKNVKANIDVVLTSGGAAALHTIKVKAKTEIANVDLYGAMQDLLAVAGAWSVTKAGVAKTISGVAKSGVFDGWVITLSDDTAADALVVSLATPAALAALALPIGGPPDNGFESNTLAVTIPA